jgi:hypothetical protein
MLFVLWNRNECIAKLYSITVAMQWLYLPYWCWLQQGPEKQGWKLYMCK